ncbi:phage tail length tape measure family protein [Pseudomonas sp.]|uniref:phage tail length tape measure family protein n=1 Tax=Pseudomonas sp. TaxID=306 RepID=UPI002628974F|nr:phage tail length tape measure family protein [Pseudomonas sp.]
MAEQKSRLVLEIDSRDAEQKATDINKALEALEALGLPTQRAMAKTASGIDGVGKSSTKTTGAIDELSESSDKVAESSLKVGETAAEASTRLLAMAKRSLETSDYVKSLSVSTTQAGNSFDYAAEKAERLSDLARRMRAESDANVKTNTTLAGGSRKAAVATDEQAQALEKLLGQIDPVTRKLTEIDRLEKELAKNKKFLDADTFADYQSKIAAARKAIGGIGDDLKSFGLTTKGSQRDAAQLLNALKSGDWQGAARNFQQISVSSGGASQALRSLGGSALGVVNPFTVAGAAAALLALAYKQGSDEASAFTLSLATTGNTAGTTTAQLATMAKQISNTGGTTGKAASVLAQLAASVRIPISSFEALTRAAMDYESATGQAAEETAKNFEKIAKDPTAEILRLNESMNFLTASTYEQIKALQDHGDAQGAAAIASDAYEEGLSRTSKIVRENLGYLESSWNAVASAAKGAWDAALNIGREKTVDDKLKALREQLDAIAEAEALRDKRDPRGRPADPLSNLTPNDDFRKQALQAQETQLLIQKAEDERRASAKGFAQQMQRQSLDDQLTLDKIRDDSASNQKKRDKKIEEYQAVVARRELEAKKKNDKSLLISAEQQEKDIAAIKEKYKDPKTPKTKAYREDAGQRMLDQARQQFAVLQEQSKVIADQTTGTVTLGAEAKKLIALETTLAELKKKGTLTVAQKQILAMGELNVAQQKLNAGLEKQNQLSAVQLENAARLKAYQDGLNAELNLAQEGLNNKNAGTGLGDRAKARLQEDLKIQQDYQKRINKLTNDYNNSTDKSVGRKQLYDDEVASAKAALDKRLAMQKESYAKGEELRANWLAGTSDAWQNYVDMAFNYNQQAQDATSQVLGNTTSSISDQIQGLLKGTTNLGNAFLSLGETMGSSILQALSEITAKWVVTQALKMAGIEAETGAVVASEGIKTTAKVTGDAVATGSSLASIATILSANVAAAATTVTSWLPAALVASIGSFGAAAVVGGGALVAAYALLKGFSDGGYTGPGGVNEVAGTVHKGEVVWSQKDISRHGGVAMVESLRKGNVSPIGAARAASAQPPAAPGAAVTPNMNVQIFNNSNSQVSTKRDQRGQLQVLINAVREDFLAGVASGDSDWARGIEGTYHGMRRER